MGLFGASHGWEEGKKARLSIICHIYTTIMKLGTVIKKIQNVYESRDIPLELS